MRSNACVVLKISACFAQTDRRTNHIRSNTFDNKTTLHNNIKPKQNNNLWCIDTKEQSLYSTKRSIASHSQSKALRYELWILLTTVLFWLGTISTTI